MLYKNLKCITVACHIQKNKQKSRLLNLYLQVAELQDKLPLLNLQACLNYHHWQQVETIFVQKDVHCSPAKTVRKKRDDSQHKNNTIRPDSSAKTLYS